MDYFESILKTLLERKGFWTYQSFKVPLSISEKKEIGKPTIPRPEIDLLAYNAGDNKLTVWEAKSFLDSSGVKLSNLMESHEVPSGRYKLFTCSNYRSIVLNGLKTELIKKGMANTKTQISLGLATGKIYQNRSGDFKKYFASKGWEIWTPDEIKKEIEEYANAGYENDPAIITTKILLR